MSENKSADEAKPSATGKVLGWLKAGVVSLFGLLSGAAIMYASPLLDRVIKPAAPLANFQAEIDGSKVVFHNRSSGGHEGWWDFGDASALEPFVSNQDVTHTYDKPGVYTVKLSLKNILGEPNERSVPVTLDAAPPVPAIDAFKVEPLQTTSYAPASFRVSAQFKNANLCIWAIGDEQPLEVITDATTTQDRMATFKQPGNYVIRFAIFNGKQVVERVEKVRVNPQPAGVTTALVQVTYESARFATVQTTPTLKIQPPQDFKDATFRFTRDIPAQAGFEITQAKLAQAPPAHVKSYRLDISVDKHTVKLTGELVRQAATLTNRNPPLLAWDAPVVLTQDRHGAAQKRPAQQAAMTLNVPGVTELPLPAVNNGWVAKGRALDLELRKDGNVVWRGTQMPRNAVVTLGNNTVYNLTVTEAADKLRIEVTPAKGVGPLGN